MKVIQTDIHDALILEPKVFGDARGFFLESYNRRVLAEAAGIRAEFVQDNHSRSARGVLRGLHYQLQQPQGKLVRVASGAVFDVAVDIRRSSPTFGKVACVELSDANQRMFWLPPGPPESDEAAGRPAGVSTGRTSRRQRKWDQPWPILTTRTWRGTAMRSRS